MKISTRQAGWLAAGLIELCVFVYITNYIIQANEPSSFTFVFVAFVLNAVISAGVLLWFEIRLHSSSVDIQDFQQTQAILQDKVRALQTIAQIEQTLGSAATLSDKTAVLLKSILAYLQVDLGCLGLINSSSNVIELVSMQGARYPDQLAKQPMRFGQGAAGWVIAHGEPVVIPDVTADARWLPTDPTTDEGIVSYLGVPLCVGEHVIGVLDFMTRTRREFTQDEIDFVKTLAGQTAIAIENTRLMESAHSELVLAQTLQAIGKLLTAEVSLSQVLDTILDLLGRVITYDSVSIQLVQENGKLEMVAGRGFADIERARQIVQELPMQTHVAEYQSGQVLCIPDTSADSSWSIIAGSEYIHSWMGVPLVVKGKFLGVLAIDHRVPNTYNETTAKAAAAFADQTAIAIANARLNDELRQRADEFFALHEITQGLTTAQDLNTLLQNITDRAIGLLRATGGGMYLYDAVRQDLQVAVTTHPATPVGTRLRMVEGMAGRVAQSRQPLIIDNYETWSGRSTQYNSASLAAILEVPMIYRGELVGVLVVEEFGNSTRKFKDDDARLLSLFAASAAGVVHTARLLTQTQQRATELEALRQASLSLTSSLDLQTVLDTVLQNIIHLSSDAQNTHIYLYENETLRFGAALWSDGQRGKEYSPPREDGITYTVARAGKIISVPDMAHDPVFGSPAHPEWQGALISLPLMAGINVLGVLNVAFATPRIFEQAQIDALQLFADQAAIAIANARLHQTVQESETRFRSLVENIPIGVYRVTPGPQGKFIFANPAHIATFGFDSLEDIQQFNVSDLYMDPSQRIIFSNLVKEKGKITGYEQQLKKKDGTPIWVSVTAQTVYQGNQVAYLDCTSIDITARKRETIARSQAENALKQRTHELEVLLEVSDSVNNLDLETVLNVVANQTRNLLNTTEATIFLLDEKENILRPIVALGDYVLERMGLRLRVGEGIVGWVAQNRQAIIINHSITDPRVRHVPGTPEEDESILCAPIVRGIQLQGVILLNRLPPIGFMPNELELLNGLAAQASGAIANARLYEATRHNALEQKIISEITRELNSSLDVYQSFPAVVKGIRALVDCDRVSLALLDAARENFTMVVMDEPHSELGRGTQLPLSATACANDVLNKNIHLTPDLSREISFLAEKALYQAGYRSRINIPLVVSDRPMGALNLVSRQVDAFSRVSLVSLRQIADTVAIALENSELFKSEQNRRNELSALYQLSRQLSDTSNRETILNLVAQCVFETIGVAMVRILLLEKNDLIVRATCPPHLNDLAAQLGQRESLDNLPIIAQTLDQNIPSIFQRNDSRLAADETNKLFLEAEQLLCLVPIRIHERALGLILLGEGASRGNDPFTPEKIRLAQNIADQAASSLHRLELFAELESAYLQSVLTLANAVDAKDSETGQHSQRLAEWALLIGEQLGLSARVMEDLRYGAILHDVGKIGVPDVVLKKQSSLTPQEWKYMYEHPVIGERILAPLPRLANAAKIVRHHHERYDGGGYPDHLSGDAIPIGARILTVVDSYGAIIDRRIYKEPRPQKQALEELRRCAGTQFDPEIVNVFVAVITQRLDAEVAP